MRIVKWFALALGALVMLVVAGVGLFLATFDPEPWRPRVQAELERALGRPIEIAGPLAVQVGMTPAITLGRVTVANLPGGSRPTMIVAETMSVAVALWPALVERRIEVTRVEVGKAELLLERLADGRGNWERPAAAAPATPPATPEQAAPARPEISVDAIALRDVTVTWIAAPGARPRVLELARFDGALPRDGQGTFTLAGKFDGADLVAEGGARRVAALATRTEAVPVSLKATVAGAELVFDGSVGPANALAGAVLFKAAGLAPILTLTGQPPAIVARAASAGAVDLHATFAVGGGKVAVEKGRLLLGDGDGRLTLDLAGGFAPAGAGPATLDLTLDAHVADPRPLARLAGMDAPAVPLRLAGKVAGDVPQRLMFAPLVLTAGQGERAIKLSLDGRLATAEAPDLGVRLEAADTGLLAELTRAALPPGPLLVAFRMGRGLMNPMLDQVRLGLGDAQLTGKIDVAAVMPAPRLRFELAGDRIDLDALMAKPAAASPTTPPALAPATAVPAGDGRVIPATPLPWRALAAAPVVRGKLTLAALTTGGVTVDDLDLVLEFGGASANLGPIAFTFAGARWNGDLAAEPRGASGRLTLAARDVDLARLATLLAWPASVASRGAVMVDIVGRGPDLRSFLGTADGKISIDAGAGRIDSGLLKGSAASLARVLLAGGVDRELRMACGVLRVAIDKGVARFQDGLVETAKLGLVLNGTAHLGTERLDLRVDPILRDPTLRLIAPSVRIGGVMADPSVTPDQAGLARGAIGALGAATSGRSDLAGLLGSALGAAGAGSGPAAPAAETCAAASAGQPLPGARPAAAPAPAAIQPAPAGRPGAVAPAPADAIRGLFEGLGRR
jgi:AsmA protein